MTAPSFVDIGSLLIGVATVLVAGSALVYSVSRGRAWDQKIAYRDELLRFANDPSAATGEARSTAKAAADYLSIELAATAQQRAVLRAGKRLQFWSRIVPAVAMWLGASTVLLIATLGLAGTSEDGIYGFGVWFSFGLMTVVITFTCFAYIFDLMRARRSTPGLLELYANVATARSIALIDKPAEAEPAEPAMWWCRVAARLTRKWRSAGPRA